MTPPLLVHAPVMPFGLADALDSRDVAWKLAEDVQAVALAGDEGWGGALVIDEDIDVALELCRAIRRRRDPLQPLLLAVASNDVPALRSSHDLYDDVILLPFSIEELLLRLDHLSWRFAGDGPSEILQHGPLALNVATYQASVHGRPLDLTYMEYELLKHFVLHPARVLTREELLREVWGYEYYGGARTVDVHVRRLRAKLGEEDARLIQTVRSVGYLFGRAV